MSASRKAVAAAILSLPLAALAATPQGSTTDTGAKAQAKLDQFCSPKNMKTYKGHVECLQETAGQSNNYADTFFAALLKKLNIEQKGATNEVLNAALDKAVTNPDDNRKLRYYAGNCSKIQDAILSPDEPLNFGYTTAYNLPKSCVENAVSFSKKYGIKTDVAEGARLTAHFAKVYKYYAANPVLPPHDIAEKKALTLSGCTRDGRSITLGISLTVKGPSERISKFDFNRYQEDMTKVFGKAARSKSAIDFLGGDAPEHIHQVLKSYNDSAAKDFGLTIDYAPRTEDTTISEEPAPNCRKLTVS